MGVREESRFVWEFSKDLRPAMAEKRRVWKSMKEKEESIEAMLEKLREVREACIKAMEFGIFEGEIKDGWGSKETVTEITPENIYRIHFDSGWLVVYLKEGKFEGEDVDYIRILDDLIDFEGEQLKKQRELLEEAAQYLKVEVVVEDEEYEDY